ncbi:hypothetical protein RFI_39552, partial [Reticulomyxa filosa]
EWLAAYYLVNCLLLTNVTNKILKSTLRCVQIKLNEQQLDDVIALSIAEIALLLNERQLSKIGKITICDECAYTLATSSSQLRGKQLDNAFQRFINRFPSYFHKIKGWFDKTMICITLIVIFAICLEEDKYIERTSQRLGEKQMDIALGKLNDKIEDESIRIKCIQLMKEISKKCNQQRLNDAFGSSMDIFT